MAVRCKLDTCGIKLKLDQWNTFTLEDRQGLVSNPCESPDQIENYRTFLTQLISERAKSEVKTLPIEENPAWQDGSYIPENVQANLERVEHPISLEQWGSLSDLQRFALIKLSRPGHESHNFVPALKEFGLMEA